VVGGLVKLLLAEVVGGLVELLLAEAAGLSTEDVEALGLCTL